MKGAKPSKLDRAIIALNGLGLEKDSQTAALPLLLVTLVYLICLLSVPLDSPDRIIWFAAYPVVQSEFSGLGYGRVFVKSLWILPLILLIAIFNPLFDTRGAVEIAGFSVSYGWLSFFSLLLRGLLAMQAVIILTLCTGFYDLCISLHKLGCPKILVTQLQFTYRYMLVMVREASDMDKARRSRGFGRKSYPLKLWGAMIGQLLIRSYERALRINNAMLSRGFNGIMPHNHSIALRKGDWCFILIWIPILVLIRIF